MNDFKICPRCKAYAKKTDLKDVYKCTGCGLIINERLDDRQSWKNISKNNDLGEI